MLDEMFKQLAAINKAPESVICLMHHPKDTHIVLESITSAGYKQASHIYWVKTNHTNAGPTGALTQIVEMGTMAYSPHRGKVHWADNKNPSDRYNTFYSDTVTSLLKDAHGEKVNVTQKPPDVAQQLMALHCVPGDDVLVLGSGTGSDVIGAINNGCNVYGVERDRKQYDASVTRIIKLVNEKGISIIEEKKVAEAVSSNKRQKVDHKAATTEEEFVPATQQDGDSLVNLQCPACNLNFVAGDSTDVCCEDGCEDFKLHTACLMRTNEKLYCAFHLPV